MSECTWIVGAHGYHGSALGCMKGTAMLRVGREHESALGCMSVHLDACQYTGMMGVHWDAFQHTEIMGVRWAHGNALGCVRVQRDA